MFMQQRYYDPGIGMFLSVDPVTADASTGANFNRYKYAANNPYRFFDPDGRLDKERVQQQQDIKSDARVSAFRSAHKTEMAAVAARDSSKVERISSDHAGGLASLSQVEGVVNSAVESTSNPWDAAEAVPKADRYVPTEAGMVDLAHVAAAVVVPLGAGPSIGDLREQFSGNASSGMSEDFLAHDAARAALRSGNPGAGAAAFIRNLGPLTEREALEGLDK